MYNQSFFLVRENEDDDIRHFQTRNVKYNLNSLEKKNVATKGGYVYNFYIDKGNVFLKEVNQIYMLDLVEGNCDIVLPENPKPTDYVLLLQDFNTVATKYNSSYFQKIKLYGNKNRIMAHDEPLICDIPFAALKLVFVDQQNGWVIF